VVPYADALFSRLGAYDAAYKHDATLDVIGEGLPAWIGDDGYPGEERIYKGRLVGRSNEPGKYAAEYKAQIWLTNGSKAAVRAVKAKLSRQRAFNERNTRWLWRPYRVQTDDDHNRMYVEGELVPAPVEKSRRSRRRMTTSASLPLAGHSLPSRRKGPMKKRGQQGRRTRRSTRR
jgi:hypothetical protein